MMHEEHLYLSLIEKIIHTGNIKQTRNGNVLSIFGEQLTFDIEKQFPLITTKQLFWKGIVEELLWFIRGNMNVKELSEKGVKIWNEYGTREYLDKHGFTDREEGNIGPMYGFQWRHWGKDQLLDVINKIITEPNSRRIIISAWNVSDLDKMVLPPCHMMAQFYITAENKLSCMVTQRSADVALGLPFNIASYALLTYMIAHVTNTIPHKLIMSIGDAHIYESHIENLKQQITLTPKPFPTITINKEKNHIDDITFEDIILTNYTHHKKITYTLNC